MRIAVTVALMWIVGATLIPDASAQVADPQGYIRSLYRQYLGVEPPPDQLSFWLAKMRTGTSPEEVNANILGSQAFFLQHQGRPESFVDGAFRSVLGRSPTPAELAYWLEKYRKDKSNTVNWAKEFLRSNGGRLPPAFVNPPGVVNNDLPQRLLTTCNLFYQAAQRECSGPGGWTVINQGRNFVDYVTASMDTLRNPSSDPRGYRRILENTENGVAGVRTTLANSALQAPQTRLYNNQIEQILTTMRDGAIVTPPIDNPVIGIPPIVRPPVVRPPVVIDGLSFGESRQLGEDSLKLSQAAEQTEYYLRGEALRDWRLARLARDLEQLRGTADGFRSAIRPGASKQSLRTSLAGLTTQTDSINQQISAGQTDPRFLQSWYQVIASLNRLGSTLGGIGVGPAPENPAIPPPNNQIELQATDRAISECDALVAGFTPYLYYHASVSQLIAEIRSMRNQLTSIRQLVATERNKFALRGAMRTVNSQMIQVERYWSAVVGGARLSNAPSVAGLETAVERLGQLISGRD